MAHSVQDTATPLGNIARRIAFSIEKASFAKLCDLVQGFRRAVGDPKSAPASPSQQLEQLMHLMAHDVLPCALILHPMPLAPCA